MAIDIAEPLPSFDTDKFAVDTRQFMNKNDLEVVRDQEKRRCNRLR
jgi:hypothetical protein